MWVAPSARRHSLGRLILRDLERYAGESGCTMVQLETSRHLPEAIATYRAAGYHHIDPFTDFPFADYGFEKRLTGPGQTSELAETPAG